jgi:hypothetical protein
MIPRMSSWQRIGRSSGDDFGDARAVRITPAVAVNVRFEKTDRTGYVGITMLWLRR